MMARMKLRVVVLDLGCLTKSSLGLISFQSMHAIGFYNSTICLVVQSRDNGGSVCMLTIKMVTGNNATLERSMICMLLLHSGARRSIRSTTVTGY